MQKKSPITTNPPAVSSAHKTIFISRSLPPASPFRSTLEAMGHTVTSESLISTSAVRFTHTPKTQWIFFSSRNAIRYFFEQQQTVDEGTKFGVTGKGSAELLAAYGKTADFTGKGVEIKQIAKDFAAAVKDETVLFPQAIDSLRSVQKELSFTNICYALFVYKTTLRTDFILPPADVLVFTSPSNVSAYCAKHSITTAQQVIAIGPSTLSRLKDAGARNIKSAGSFDEEGLLAAVLVSGF